MASPPPNYDNEFVRAAESKDLETMTRLLKEKKIHLDDNLHIAIIRDQLYTVELILENGGNPNVKGPKNLSPLYTGIFNFNPELVDILLKHNASLTDVEAISRRTALDVAVAQKSWLHDADTLDDRLEKINNIIRAIVRHGMNLADEVQSKHYKLCDAILKNDVETAKKLIDETEDKAKLPLELAVVEGKLELAELMLKNGADSDNHSTIFSAIKCNNYEMVKLLCDHKARLNILDREHYTPLCRAVDKGVEMVKLLIQYKANVDYAMNALHQACILGDLEMVKLLIENKADVNRRLGPMIRPLHDAVHYPEIVKVLLDNGAEVNAKNTWGQTPMDLAASLGLSDSEALKSVNLLKERGGEMTGKIWTADALDQDKSRVFVANFKFEKGKMGVGSLTTDEKGASFSCKFEKFVKPFDVDDQNQPGPSGSKDAKQKLPKVIKKKKIKKDNLSSGSEEEEEDEEDSDSD